MRKDTICLPRAATARAHSNRQSTKIIDPPTGIWIAFCNSGHARRKLGRKKNPTPPRLCAHPEPSCQEHVDHTPLGVRGRPGVCGEFARCSIVPLSGKAFARNLAVVVAENAEHFALRAALGADLMSAREALCWFVYQLFTRDRSYHSPPTYSDGYVVNAIKYQIRSDRRQQQSAAAAIRLLCVDHDDGNQTIRHQHRSDGRQQSMGDAFQLPRADHDDGNMRK